MSDKQLPPIERLKDRDDYDLWKFAVRTYLEHEGLWGCVMGTNLDKEMDEKTRSKIILLVDPLNCVHVESTTTAKEAWDNLAAAFEDTGLLLRVGLLRTLITTNLGNSDSIEHYVNKIISTAHKLSNVGFQVSDEWVGTLLLAGLPIEYKPLMISIESSGIQITADSVKAKLLQDETIEYQANNSQSQQTQQQLDSKGFRKGRKRFREKGLRCFQCNKYGHIARHCTKLINIKVKKDNTNSDTGNSGAENKWYLD